MRLNDRVYEIIKNNVISWTNYTKSNKYNSFFARPLYDHVWVLDYVLLYDAYECYRKKLWIKQTTFLLYWLTAIAKLLFFLIVLETRSKYFIFWFNIVNIAKKKYFILKPKILLKEWKIATSKIELTSFFFFVFCYYAL